MAKTDKQRLEHAATIIREWDPNGTIIEVEHAFLILDEIPRNKHKAQWEEVRKAIREHPDLNTPLMKEQTGIPSYARQGHWWWNPDEW